MVENSNYWKRRIQTIGHQCRNLIPTRLARNNDWRLDYWKYTVQTTYKNLQETKLDDTNNISV